MQPETLERLMARWSFHSAMADSLAQQIEMLVLAKKESVVTPDGVASYSEGRGSYDYAALAAAVRAPAEVIEQHTQAVTDWRAVCGAVGIPDHIKARFYEPNEKGPRVTLKRQG
jgi:hypothetical protein